MSPVQHLFSVVSIAVTLAIIAIDSIVAIVAIEVAIDTVDEGSVLILAELIDHFRFQS